MQGFTVTRAAPGFFWGKDMATDFMNMAANAQYGADYQTPDWVRQNFGMGFSSYDPSYVNNFFANNPQYAQDFQNIASGGKSAYSTDSSTLIKTPFDSMSPEAQQHYAKNPNELLASEGFGQDPTLTYMNYYNGPGSIGITDPKRTNTSEYLRNNQWTPNGIQAGNNAQRYAALPWGGGSSGVTGANSYSTRPLQVDAQGNPIASSGQSGAGSNGMASWNQGVSGNNGVSSGTAGLNQSGSGNSGTSSWNQGVSGNNGGSNYNGGSGSAYSGGASGGGSMSSNFAMNPYLQQMGDMIAGTMTNNWQRGVQPQIASGAMAAGGYGGSRQGVVEANSANDLNQGIGSALSSLYGNGYNTGLQYDLGTQNVGLGYANLDRNINNDNLNWQMQGANFGLGIYDRMQQANNLGLQTGSQIQNTPLNYWNQFSQGANSIGQGYGTSTSTSGGNPMMGAMGGAQLGGQIGNWWSNQSPNAAGGANSQGWGTGSGYGNQDYGSYF